MPLYEYKCQSCDRVQEELHRAGSRPRVRCGACGDKCQKMVSLATIHGTDSSRTANYQVDKAVSGAKDERRESEKKDHMGSDPYGDMDKPGVIPDVDIVDKL